MQKINLFITYNDHISPIKDTSGISQNPFGEIQIESGEKVPILYFFNEPRLGSVRQRERLQQIIISENWIIFCPISLQNSFVSILRELLGRRLEFKRLSLRQNQEQIWKNVLEQRLQPLVTYSSKLYFQFFKIDFPTEETKKSDIERQDPKIQWRRPLVLLTITFGIIGSLFFLENKWQLLSVWSGRTLKLVVSSDIAGSTWNNLLIQKIIDYTPDLEFNKNQNSLTSITTAIERDRLTVGFGLFPQTLATMQTYGWSEPLFMSGLVVVQKMLPDSLQPLTTDNLQHFFKKIGYLQVAGIDTALTGRMRRNLSARNVNVLSESRMSILMNQLKYGNLDCIALEARGIRNLGNVWERTFLPQLTELVRERNLSSDVARLWSGFRLFVYKDSPVFNNLKTLNGKIGLLTLGTTLTVDQIANRGLDTTRVQLLSNNDPNSLLDAVNSGVLKAAIIQAIIFESQKGSYPVLKTVSPLISQEFFALFFHRSRTDLKQKLDRAIAILAFQSEKNVDIGKLFMDQSNQFGDKVVDWFPNVK